MDQKRINLSIVVPVHNEEKSVVSLHKEILEVCQSLGQNFEIIFVDDGSTDQTFEALLRLRPLKIIKFRTNFGQSAALAAGLKASQGEVVVTLDGDGQNDPRDIPQLLTKLKQDFDAVAGWRCSRQDTWWKRLGSGFGFYLHRILLNERIHDTGCTLKAMRRACLKELDLLGEEHRFIPALLAWKGFRIGEIKVNHRPRRFGQTKYSYSKFLRATVDLINVWFWRKYSTRPLHLFGGAGLMMMVLGSFVLFILAILRLFFAFSLQNRIWPLVALFLFLAGLQLFASGLLADMAAKSHYRNGARAYIIEKKVDNRAKE